MTHLLWKYYWENDVDKFRRLLAPVPQSTANTPSKSQVVGPQPWGTSPNFGGLGTSPRAPKPRKSSGYGSVAGASKGGASGIGKSEINSRDYAGMTLLLPAASSANSNAADFVRALLEHPALDLHVQDAESGWNALHRALYHGNISIARMLLDQERRGLMEKTSASAVSRVGQLIKTKDNEGNSPFDLYNATIATRNLKESAYLDHSDSASESDASSDDDQFLARSVAALDGVTWGEEIFIFGSNKNLSLGVGDEDDRQFPERIILKRPDHLLRKFFDEYLQEVRDDPTSPPSAHQIDPDDLAEVPALIKNRPLKIQDAVLSKFHSAILTTDPVSNMYVCGVGRSGRLGLGHENTQFRFAPVQGGLADKRITQVALGQSHTVALTDAGEVWTWGSNNNAQLGFALPPARKDEEPMSVTPRQVFGPLKKETILGIAASAAHSVAHTSTSLFCWGRNLGQLALMDADSRSLEVQVTPRKVATSLFSSNIVAVSAIEKATTCLLEDSSVCVFTSYGYNFVRFPIPDVFANQQFTPRSMSTRYDSSRNAIKSITSGGETIAAVSSRGDLFTVALNHRAESAPTATSTTNPSKIKGALSMPICIWNARKDGVKSVSVGEHGSVIICTESGAVWRRVKRAKAKDAGPMSADTKRGDFKFQRVPSVTKAVAVRSSTFGAFAAIRKDCDVMREQMHIDEPSLWQDLAPLSPLRGFRASELGSEDKDTLKFWDATELKERLGGLAYEVLKSPDLESDLKLHLHVSSWDSAADTLLCTTSSPDIFIPIHGWMLAARSPTMRHALATYRRTGEPELGDLFIMEEQEGKTVIKFQSIDIFSLVNVVAFCYDDVVIPAWNFTRQAPPLAYRYRQVRSEVMKIASKLHMVKLEASARLQTSVEKSLDKDMKTTLQDPHFFEDADAVVELDGDEIPVHSQLLRQRCEFFEGLFHGRSGGMWLAGRQDISEDEGQVRVDLQHTDPEAFHYVLRYLYADAGEGLFNDVVSTDIDHFSELVLHVLSIANELMLDRLSQICQFVLGRFVTSRNVGLLLNEISPCSVTEFKDAGLEYVCLQMEMMLENHYLDNLDEDLLGELDEVVRQNQLARSPFVRSGRAQLVLLDDNPELAYDIDEERQRRVREMAFKATQQNEEKKLSSSFRTRFGSLEDVNGTSPAQDRMRRKSKADRNEPFSPTLRPKDSKTDLIFDMDEEGPSNGASPSASPAQGAASGTHLADVSRFPPLSGSLRNSEAQLAVSLTRSPMSSPPLAETPQRTPGQSPHVGNKGKSAAAGSPWGAAPLSTSKIDLREVLEPGPGKSALSAGLDAQKVKETSPKAAPPKMSQKERKKQQLAQVAAQAAQEAEENLPRTAWAASGSGANRSAPWKVVSSGSKTSIKDAMADSAQATPAKPKPVVSTAESSKAATRRTASPDTRFSGQSRPSSSVQHATDFRSASGSAKRPSTKPLAPHSKSYTTPATKSEPSLGLSMTDIIGQQKREQEIVKEAVAKRSMQEIQQEQEFQEWWDQESRRIQEEEARRANKEKGRAEKDKEKGQKGGSKRGRRGRPHRGGADGPGGHGEARGDDGASGSHSATKAGGPSNGGRNRGNRARGAKA